MSKNPKGSPIGRVWTRVLLAIHEATAMTASDVAVMLAGPSGLGPADLTGQQRGRALVALMKMQTSGYVRRVDPDLRLPLGLWVVDEGGTAVIDELSRARPRRRYRSSRVKRIKARNRRDDLRRERLCINGRAHGPATNGCRCHACHEKHKETR